MTSDDPVWTAYAKGVKKIRKAKAVVKPVSSSRRKSACCEAASALTLTRCIHRASASDSEHKSPRPADAGGWIPTFVGMTQKAKPLHIILDRRVEKNIRQGDIALEARIDLHGMTQSEAYDALARFMAKQVKAGRRNLLVITGKGRGNAGVLKTNLPMWLQSLPEASAILTLRPAAPKHGGDGAFYVVLRKRPEVRG